VLSGPIQEHTEVGLVGAGQLDVVTISPKTPPTKLR
jgi:hypothetical protein